MSENGAGYKTFMPAYIDGDDAFELAEKKHNCNAVRYRKIPAQIILIP